MAPARWTTIGVALVGLTLIVAACGSTSDSGDSHPVATAKFSTTTTTEGAVPDPALVQDARAVATDLASISSDENNLDQLAETVTNESQALEQLTTNANDGEAVCYSQLSTQAATLSSNADALDGAAQKVTNDVTQLNGAEMTYRDLELSEPSKAPVDAPSFATVLDAIGKVDGDLGNAGAERGSVNLTVSGASGNEMASRTC
jgi:hypothetical protein